MAIVGFNLLKMSVERKEAIDGEIKVNSKADISDVKKEKIELVKGKETLRMNFEFSIIYEPDFAKIEFEGFVLLVEDKNKADNILKDWKKKKIDNAIKEQVFNLILRKCNIKAFSLEEDLNLPTHFPLPRLKSE
jgi:hypothetical protein